MLLYFAAFVFLVGCSLQVRDRVSSEPAVIRTGKSTQTVLTEGLERRYLLYVPTSYNPNTPLPLLFNFHGSGSTPQKQFEYGDFKRLADSKGFIVASPAGQFKSYGKNSWNADLLADGVNDVQMIKDIIAQLSDALAIDLKRVYATGFSGGARLISRAACELSDVVAAVAPVAGIQFPEPCHTARGMPVITFHGQGDLVNHYALRSNSRTYWTSGVEDSVEGWVRNNQCNASQSIRISELVIRRVWSGCRDGGEVDFYRIEDGGHTWPGSPVVIRAIWAGETNTDIVASELIWEFFEKHALP